MPGLQVRSLPISSQLHLPVGKNKTKCSFDSDLTRLFTLYAYVMPVDALEYFSLFDYEADGTLDGLGHSLERSFKTFVFLLQLSNSVSGLLQGFLDRVEYEFQLLFLVNLPSVFRLDFMVSSPALTPARHSSFRQEIEI